MRIAIYAETFLPKCDGVTNTICYLLEYLRARGHASMMFAPQGGPARYADTRIVGLTGLTFPLYPELRLVPPIARNQDELGAFRPDVVLLINPCSLGLVGLRQGRALGVPVVASYHTDLPGYAARYGLSALRDPLWAYLRWLHNQADLNLCPSHFTQTELQEHGFERVRVWGHGVDGERFHPRHRDPEWRTRLSGGDPEAPLLLYVGRLAVEKRVDWLRPVVDALPHARLAIVGDGPTRPELEAMFTGTRTHFTGYLRGTDLSCAYASADVFAFPSANETFGNVVLEAMASGLPVVVPRSGGPVDHVFEGQNGLLTDPGDPDRFVEAVRRLVVDPAYARRLGRGARAHALTQSWDAILDGLIDDLVDVTRRDRRSTPSTPWFVGRSRHTRNHTNQRLPL
jgi:glycosyltransferase involved in cell wall biosynthesis